MTTYEISVSNPWFNYIKNKKKKVEGRLNKNIFAQLKKGDIVIFTNNDMKIKTKIKRITKYKSFNDYLTQEGLRTTLPNIKTIDDGIAIYRQFYSEEKEREYGVLAIKIKIIPYLK
jgi:ASC-1-like (ASCH) protein